MFDSSLKETAQRLTPLVTAALGHDVKAPADRPQPAPPAGRDILLYQLRAADGSVLSASRDAPAAPFEAPLEAGFHDTLAYRVLTTELADRGLYLQVADLLADRREAAGEDALALLGPLLLLVPLSALAIWLIVGRAMAPIEALRRRIGERDGANLAPLEAEDIPSELSGIVVSVDRLLERLRLALEAEREFTANSAHELRTPIAGALAQTQRLVAELPAGAGRRRAAQVEAALVELARLAEKLLQLARAEAGIGTASKNVDLVPVVELVVGDFLRRPGCRDRLKLDVADQARLVRRVDVDAFAIALRNLIENALDHGDKSAPVEVAVGDDLSLSVVNGGAVVEPDELAGLTQRFRRGPSRAKGTGLGLAIANALVRQMGGRLDLASPAPGRPAGFAARISFG